MSSEGDAEQEMSIDRRVAPVAALFAAALVGGVPVLRYL
jgi:hypothetical protein